MTTKSPYLFVSYAETNRVLAEPYQRIVVATIAAAILCMPLVAGGYFLHLMNLCFIAVIGAVGINLLTGYCGQLSLGQASFLAIGAFTTAILSQRFGMPFFVAIPVSCCAGAAVGFVVGLPHPGGNLTGFIDIEAGMGGKWLALLTEIAPGMRAGDTNRHRERCRD